MALQNTKLYLLHVDIEKDYQHTLFFETPEEQFAYFRDKTPFEFYETNYSYQRLNHTIDVEINCDKLLAKGINYAVYQNADYEFKWFFCFITDLKYMNSNVTRISLETDVMQTWYFDYILNPSFIEREHTSNDLPGNNLLDEGLELGEYIVNNHMLSGFSDKGLSVVVGVTENPDGAVVSGGMVQNSYSSIQYYVYKASEGNDETGELSDLIASYDSEAAANAIVCVFLAPTALVGNAESNLIVADRYKPNRYFINGGSGEEGDIELEITTGKLNGYTPRNKKLLTYPFRYMLCSNNAGASAVYKYELFSATNKKQTFLIEGVVTPGCSIRLTPMFYNGEMQNDEEGLNMGKFPVCNWNSDIYTNWLTQNGVNIATNLITAAAKIAGGVVAAYYTGGAASALGLGTAASGVQQVTSTLTQIHEQSFVPAQSKGNTNSGDVITASMRNDFHFYDMTIKRQYAEIIDDYFDMYGYKVNRVKRPAWNHRQAYWFLKTIEANIMGEIPQNDLLKLKSIFNKGVTFWRSNARFRDYTQDNSII